MRGRPLRVRWTHTVEDLVARIQQEPDPRRRQRLQALLLLRAGQRLTDVSETLGVHYRTVQRWVDWYRTGGLDAVLERTPGYAAPGRQSFLSPEQTEELLCRYASGELRTVRDAIEWVVTHYGVRYSTNGMYALLRRAKKRENARRRNV